MKHITILLGMLAGLSACASAPSVADLNAGLEQARNAANAACAVEVPAKADACALASASIDRAAHAVEQAAKSGSDTDITAAAKAVADAVLAIEQASK